MPLFSKSQAWPRSDGNTRTGRAKWPYLMTVPAAPRAADHSSVASRFVTRTWSPGRTEMTIAASSPAPSRRRPAPVPLTGPAAFLPADPHHQHGDVVDQALLGEVVDRVAHLRHHLLGRPAGQGGQFVGQPVLEVGV